MFSVIQKIGPGFKGDSTKGSILGKIKDRGGSRILKRLWAARIRETKDFARGEEYR